MHNNQKLLFVINPISGGKTKTNWEASIRSFFENTSFATEYFIQTGGNDKAAIQAMIEKFTPDKVIAVGGDGTVKMVAGIIKESTIVLGIVPAGSANGLAKELGIPEKLEDALNIIISGKQNGLDAIKINEEELCFHISDVGLNALLIKYFEEGKVRGMWGYARSVFKMLWNKRKMRVTIETDSGTVKRNAFMVALANAEKYGTGAVINPYGNVSDGVFEVVVVRRLHLSEIIKAITAHKSFDTEKIEVFQTKNVCLTLQQKGHFQVDGEYMGKTAGIKARVLPSVVQVMLPQQGPVA